MLHRHRGRVYAGGVVVELFARSTYYAALFCVGREPVGRVAIAAFAGVGCGK